MATQHDDHDEAWRDVVREGYQFGKWYLGWSIIAAMVLAVIVVVTLWITG